VISRITQHSQNNNAIRLTFSYEGTNNIQLISKQTIEKVLHLPSELAQVPKNQIGTWYELSDESRVIYRQLIVDPIKMDAEVFSKTTGSISRHRLSTIRGAFSIVIPNIPEAKYFDLFSNPMISGRVRGHQKPPTIFHMNLKEGS
jgi:hypothetical protein